MADKEGNKTKNVSTGKPLASGALWVAPLGTALPTDAVTPLGEEFEHLGYVSSDGLTDTPERETEDMQAWGGDTVLNVTTSYSETFTYTLIEAMRVSVLKHVYGDDAVTGTLDTGIKIEKSSKELPHKVFVADIAMQGEVIRRIVVADGKVTEVGEISYKDDELIGYETTLKAYPDSKGVTSHEYIAKAKVA